MARRSDDAILIGLIRRGDREALERLMHKYWAVAWRAAYRVLMDRASSDDAAQEALQRAIRALDTFDEERPFAPWLTRIAVNCALDELRRDRRLAPVAESPEPAEAERWSDGADDLQIAVAEAVAALPLEKRTVVVLHYWLDYAAKDIADVLDIPLGTVLSRLSRARAELRKTIEEEENAA